jgi:hypothetical protein
LNADKLDYDVYLFTDCFGFVEECIKHKIKPMLLFKSNDPKLQQRTIKCCPDKYLPSSIMISIWVDGNSLPLFKNINNYDLIRNEVICFRHPRNNSPIEEMEIVLKSRLTTNAMIDSIMDLYKHYGFDGNSCSDLSETCLLIRKHTPKVIEMGEKWRDCVTLCPRDQLSFNFLLWLYKIDYHSIEWKDRPMYKTNHDNPHTRVLK